MADKVTNSNAFSFTIGLERDGETTTRNFQLEAITISDPKDAAESFRDLLIGKFNKFIQPSGWRDADITDEEWLTTSVKVKLITKKETEFNFD